MASPARTLQSFDPATGEQLEDVQLTTEDEAKGLIASARAAQKDWAKTSFSDRAKCVRRVKKYLAENADRAAALISRVNGKTRQDALATEVLPCIMACEWYAANASKALASSKISMGNILFANKKNVMTYSPVGVVGIISPWNYPFSIPFGEVIMGLMAGNAIVLKVAACSVLVGCFIEECIQVGGFPAGLFAHLVTSGPVTSKVMFETRVDKIFFTGSVPIGKQLMRDASTTLTPLSLELGGKDPMVVLEDADLERATNACLWGGFQNAGQSCAGIERVYVHRRIFDKFISMMAAKTSALRHGPDNGAIGAVDIGSMTTKSQLDLVRKQVDEAVTAGAKIVAQSRPVGDVSKGLFYPATLMIGVQHSMALMRDETFGPVIPVMPFDTVDEAIELANDCSMALTASVFGKKNAQEIARRLDGGVVTINDHLYTHGMAEAPWGGWKESGLGRTHGKHGLREMSNLRCVNSDVVTLPRNLWWYPFSERSYAGVRAGVGFVCPKGVKDFFSSVGGVLSFAVPHMFKAWRLEELTQVATAEEGQQQKPSSTPPY